MIALEELCRELDERDAADAIDDLLAIARSVANLPERWLVRFVENHSLGDCEFDIGWDADVYGPRLIDAIARAESAIDKVIER